MRSSERRAQRPTEAQRQRSAGRDHGGEAPAGVDVGAGASVAHLGALMQAGGNQQMVQLSAGSSRAAAVQLEGGGPQDVAQETPEHDAHAPSKAAQGKFLELKYAEDEQTHAFIVNELLALGVTQRQIEEYLLTQTGTHWERTKALFGKGKFVYVEEDGKESFRFQMGKDGAQFSGEHAEVDIGKNAKGTGVTTRFDANGDEVEVTAGVQGGGDGVSGAGARTQVTHDGGTTTVDADMTRQTGTLKGDDGQPQDAEAYGGSAGVSHRTKGGTVVDVAGGGGTDLEGRGKGHGSARYSDGDGDGGNLALDGADKGGAGTEIGGKAGYSVDGHSVAAEGRGGANRTVVGANGELKPGDQVSVTLHGRWERADGDLPNQSAKGGAGVKVGQAQGSVGYEHKRNAERGKDGVERTLIIDSIVVDGQQIPLGELDGWAVGLGFAGTIDIKEYAGNTWSLSTSLDVKEGAHTLTFKTAFGEQTIQSLNGRTQLDFTGGGAQTQDGVYGEAEIGYQGRGGSANLKGRGVDNGEAVNVGVEGNVAVGDKASGRHQVDFVYEAQKSDAWRHYAALNYKHLAEGYSVGAGATVEVSPGEDVYDQLWKLHANAGFQIAKGHTLSFEVGVTTDGENVAWEISAEWDWAGLMNVKLAGGHGYKTGKDGQTNDAYGVGLEVKPGGEKSPISGYVGYTEDADVVPISKGGYEESFDGGRANVGFKVVW